MTGFLLDTNVVSELVKPKPHGGVVAWLSGLEAVTLSAVTIEELTFGVERARGKAREGLRGWLSALLAAHPAIVDVTAEVAAAAGRLRAQREAAGRPVPQADMLVAACALSRGLVLATRNTRDFAGCGLTLFNPFESPPAGL